MAGISSHRGRQGSMRRTGPSGALSLLDPGDLRFRTWPLRLEPHPTVPEVLDRDRARQIIAEGMHPTVLTRLRARQTLVREACQRRALEFQLRDWLHYDQISLVVPLSFLARLTITTPKSHDYPPRAFPLLPPEAPAADPSQAESTFRDVITAERAYLTAEFQEHMVASAWDPLPGDADLLQEYTEVLETLSRRRGRDRRWRGLPDPGSDQLVRLQVGAHLYQIPGRNLRSLGRHPTPSAATVALLSYAHATNDRTLRRRLRDARIERELRAAWNIYLAWLRAEELREEAVKNLFEPFFLILPKANSIPGQ